MPGVYIVMRGMPGICILEEDMPGVCTLGNMHGICILEGIMPDTYILEGDMPGVALKEKKLLSLCQKIVWIQCFQFSRIFCQDHGEDRAGDEELEGGAGMGRGRSFSSYMGIKRMLVML